MIDERQEAEVEIRTGVRAGDGGSTFGSGNTVPGGVTFGSGNAAPGGGYAGSGD